jgi:hypothetical protein
LLTPSADVYRFALDLRRLTGLELGRFVLEFICELTEELWGGIFDVWQVNAPTA